MKLHEVLNSPAQYKWVQDTDSKKVAIFNIDREIAVNFYHHGEMNNGATIWYVSFHPTDTKSDEMTGEGDALLVMSTVLSIIEDAIRSKGVKAMLIQAKLHEPSRVLLYKRLVNQLTKKHGWKIYDDDTFESMHEWLIGEPI